MLTQISTIRWKKRSTQPPKKPWQAPATMPIRLEIDGDDQREEHRDAEAVDHPRQHVAGLVVGAEPVVAVGRRGGGGDAVVDGVEAVRDRRPEDPARLGDRLAVDGALGRPPPRRSPSGSSRQASRPPVRIRQRTSGAAYSASVGELAAEVGLGVEAGRPGSRIGPGSGRRAAGRWRRTRRRA